MEFYIVLHKGMYLYRPLMKNALGHQCFHRVQKVLKLKAYRNDKTSLYLSSLWGFCSDWEHA